MEALSFGSVPLPGARLAAPSPQHPFVIPLSLPLLQGLPALGKGRGSPLGKVFTPVDCIPPSASQEIPCASKNHLSANGETSMLSRICLGREKHPASWPPSAPCIDSESKRCYRRKHIVFPETVVPKICITSNSDNKVIGVKKIFFEVWQNSTYEKWKVRLKLIWIMQFSQISLAFLCYNNKKSQCSHKLRFTEK